MGKNPAMFWFTGDWLTDPQVSALSPSARGIWFDALCAMHRNGATGELTGTVAALARICRCSEEEMCAALVELTTTSASLVRHNGVTSASQCDANVTECCGTVTLVNRRMQREYKERLGSKLRMRKSRSHSNVTRPSSSSSSSSSSVPPEQTARAAKKTTPKKPPDGIHHEFVRAFCERWAKRYGDDYPFSGAKDGATVKALREFFKDQLDKFASAVERYLADPDPFVASQNHPLTLMRARLTKYLVAGPVAPPVRVFEECPQDKIYDPLPLRGGRTGS